VISASPGGSAANQAAWLGHLGCDVVFAGRCGARDAAYHRASLESYGVDARLAVDAEAQTGTIVIMVSADGERTMFTDRGANLRLLASDVRGLLDGAAALHLTGYTFFAPSLRAVASSLIADARSRGIAVTIDPGSAAFLARLAPGEFVSWTSGANVCFPNIDEASVLTGATEPLTMAGELTKHYGVVVLKLGAAGCVLAVPGESAVVVPGAAAAEVIDSTGAGDAFCAGFLSRWLATDEVTLADAAQYAVRIAATAVTKLGGRPR
jgi:sugar/nucleoside kinase (ribokinase family)